MARNTGLRQSKREINMEKCIVEVYEDIVYWKNEEGQYHRLGGLPAIEWADGSKEYYENGKHHRLGGLPATEWADGNKVYWENGIQLTEAEAEVKRNPKSADPCDGKIVTIDGKEYRLTAV
jgi:hypothetical protein